MTPLSLVGVTRRPLDRTSDGSEGMNALIGPSSKDQRSYPDRERDIVYATSSLKKFVYIRTELPHAYIDATRFHIDNVDLLR